MVRWMPSMDVEVVDTAFNHKNLTDMDTQSFWSWILVIIMHDMSCKLTGVYCFLRGHGWTSKCDLRRREIMWVDFMSVHDEMNEMCGLECGKILDVLPKII